MNIQNTMRDFVTTGDAAALASCQRSIKLEPQLFDQLVSLTRRQPRAATTIEGPFRGDEGRFRLRRAIDFPL